MILYAVSSLRDYGCGEIYFSTDGIFTTEEDAHGSIARDIAEVKENYEELYGECVWPEPDTTDFDNDYTVWFDNHRFAWRIDRFDL